MPAATTSTMVEWGIQFTLDDADLAAKVKIAKERTAALAKSIESGTYFQLQRAAINTAREYDTLIKKSNQLLVNEQRLARESERRRKYGRLGDVASMTERYYASMKEKGYSRASLSGGLMKIGAVGTGALLGAAAAGGPAVSDTIAGSFKMVGLAASRAMIPALASTSKWLQDVARSIEEVNDKYPKLMTTIGYLALGAGVLGAVGGTIKGIAYVGSGLKAGAAMAGSAWGAGMGLLSTTAGYGPPPPASTAGKTGAPMARFAPPGSTTGQSPMAQHAPPGASIGSALTSGATAGFMARAIGMASKVWWPLVIATTAYEIANATGAIDWVKENHPFQNTITDKNGKSYTEKQWQDRNEEKRKHAMAGLGLSLNSYSATDYRDAAQSAVLNTSPLEAENFQLVMKRATEFAKEMGVAVENLSEAARNLKNGTQPGVVPPGS